ncbi:T9SS type A sorting domain-containing protein [Algibacter sp. AS12]|uniref:T9SS type A sorting domain-containing protein n=1 Tax=Algibacter sp. AS12 TaxID=3135773 RepID=UPI00398B09D0
MKTQLLKKLTFAFALFAVATLSAQGPWTFDADLENFAANFGTGQTIVWDADGGEGALKMTRITGNANFGPNVPNKGGGIDADAFNTVRIKIKNGSDANSFRVGATGGDATAGNININGVLAANSSVYVTYDLPMSGAAFWNGTLSNFWIAIRGNPGSLGAEGDIFVSSIELVNVTPLPPAEFSEFIANPNFEDITGLGHMSGGANYDRSIIETDSQNGDRNMQLTFNTDPTSTQFTFSNFAKTYTPNLVADDTQFTVKVWVKSAHDADIIVRLKNNDDGAPGIGGNEELIDDTQSLIGNNTWQELTFTILPTIDVEQINFWFAVNVVDGTDPNDPKNGDTFYFDNMSASIGAPTLSIKQNTLQGVSVYPNPVKETLSINSPAGSDISIYNVLGATVKTINKANALQKVSVSNLKSGLYFVKVINDGKVFQNKIIKN